MIEDGKYVWLRDLSPFQLAERLHAYDDAFDAAWECYIGRKYSVPVHGSDLKSPDTRSYSI